LETDPNIFFRPILGGRVAIEFSCINMSSEKKSILINPIHRISAGIRIKIHPASQANGISSDIPPCLRVVPRITQGRVQPGKAWQAYIEILNKGRLNRIDLKN